MTKEAIEHLIKILNAYKEGKSIEVSHKDGEWVDISKTERFNLHPYYYRIKPEPKYRAYKNAKEFLTAQNKHGLWLKIKDDTQRYLPMYVNERCVGLYVLTKDTMVLISFEQLKDKYIFEDDTPCGILEELT